MSYREPFRFGRQDRIINNGLHLSTLSKAANLNITIAETKFNLQNNEIVTKQNETQQQSPNYLIQDFFVTCSIDRDKSYTLTINLELDNPFKMVEFEYRQPNDPTSKGIFKIFMNQSTYLVQLNQRISYDECLDIKYVQLDPNLNYEINCTTCDEEQKVKLDKLLSKRMTQLDSELNSLLSEKLLLGLQVLLNQQRLDLDLFLS